MDASIPESNPPLPAVETDILADRRRPGRTDADPVLIPLLREVAQAGLSEAELDGLIDRTESFSTMDRSGEGNAAKGIVVALMLSLPFWLVAAFLGVMILH